MKSAPKPKYPEAERLEFLLALPLDFKRGACVYEALRRVRRTGGMLTEWGAFSPQAFAFERGIGEDSIANLPHWIEQDTGTKQASVFIFNFPVAARLVEVWTKEDRASVVSTLSDTRNMWTCESVIAVRIQWSQGISAILKDLEAILMRHSPQPTPGAHDNLDERSARGKRIGNGELDPALESLEAVSLLENGLAVIEVARRLQIDRRKVQRARTNVSDLLFDWFVREAPAN